MTVNDLNEKRIALGERLTAAIEKRDLRVKKGLALYNSAEVFNLVIAGALNGAVLFKATRAAKKEEWSKASYYAIVWAGFANNMANAHAHRQRQRAHRLPGN